MEMCFDYSSLTISVVNIGTGVGVVSSVSGRSVGSEMIGQLRGYNTRTGRQRDKDRGTGR